MPSCALRYCKSRYNKESIREYSLFSFPPISDAGREKWIQFVQRERSEPFWHPSTASKLCSKHFKSEDIYYGKTGRRVIKKGSIPYYINEVQFGDQFLDNADTVADIVTTEYSRSGSPLSEDLISDTDSIFDTPLVANLKTQLKLEKNKSTAQKEVIKKCRSKIRRLEGKVKYFKNETTKLRKVVKTMNHKTTTYKKVIHKLTECIRNEKK